MEGARGPVEGIIWTFSVRVFLCFLDFCVAKMYLVLVQFNDDAGSLRFGRALRPVRLCHLAARGPRHRWFTHHHQQVAYTFLS